METKKDNVLTLLLIIVIVIIVGIIGYLGFEVINGNIKQSQSEEITDEFDSLVPTITEEELQETLNNDGENQTTSENNGNSENTTNNNGNSNNGSGSSNKGNSGGSSSSSGGYAYSASGVYINGLWTVGTIRIPATGIRYSIFSEPTTKALDKGVCIVYTANGLNQPGNTVIAGHNYRNKLFFSKNKNLVVGNLIMIKDTSGVEVTYEIYNKFITYESDASFYQRDTGGKREINLSTCTDDGTKTGRRIIISAREK